MTKNKNSNKEIYYKDYTTKLEKECNKETEVKTKKLEKGLRKNTEEIGDDMNCAEDDGDDKTKSNSDMNAVVGSLAVNVDDD